MLYHERLMTNSECCYHIQHRRIGSSVNLYVRLLEMMHHSIEFCSTNGSCIIKGVLSKSDLLLSKRVQIPEISSRTLCGIYFSFASCIPRL